MSLLRESFLSYKSVNVGAGQRSEVNVSGSLFTVQDSTAQFLVQFDEQTEFIPLESGMSLRMPGGEMFRKLTLRNDTAAALTVNFYVGSIAVVDARLGRINTGLYLTGHPFVSLDPAEVTVFTGINGTDLRKQIVVTNLDAASDLKILDSSDNVAATIPPGTAWTLECGGTIKVQNATAAPIPFNVGETWFDLS